MSGVKGQEKDNTKKMPSDLGKAAVADAKQSSKESFWYIPTTDREIVNQGKTWCEGQSPSIEYKLAPQTGNAADLSKVSIDKVLVIYCHSTDDGTKVCVGRKGGNEMGAKEFAEYLNKDAKLNCEHNTIEIFACNSNFFIVDLWRALNNKNYTNLTLLGYNGECIPASSSPGVRTAGLYGLDTLQVKAGGTWSGIDKRFAASRHQVAVSSEEEAKALIEANKIETLKLIDGKKALANLKAEATRETESSTAEEVTSSKTLHSPAPRGPD